jgi:hypothetical protein
MLFLTGCIPVRLFLVYLAKTQPAWLNIMGWLYLLIAIAMLNIYLYDLRPTGLEAGGRIWWNNIRPLHSLLYFLFAYLAITGSQHAWLALLADTVLGVMAFTWHHYLS